MRSIFYNFEAIFFPQCMNSFHIAWLPSQMHRDNNFRELSYFFSSYEFLFQFLRAEIVRFRININEINLSSAI